MKDRGQQTDKRGPAYRRRFGRVRFAALSAVCAMLIVVVSMGVYSISPLATGGLFGFTQDASMQPNDPSASDNTSRGSNSANNATNANDARDGDKSYADSDAPNANARAADGAAASGDAVSGSSSSAAPTKKPSKPAKTPTGMSVPEEMVPEVKAEHEQEVVLVSFAEGYTANELTAAIQASGCTVPQAITEDDVAAGFATLKVADGYDVEHAMTQLGLLPELGGAQPNFIYHLADDAAAMGAIGAAGQRADNSDATSLVSGGISSASNGSLLGQTTDIDDTYKNELWSLDSINAYRAWDTTRANGEVTVAVFDNGFRISHKDLENNIIASAGYNSVQGSSQTDVLPFYGYDDANHGSHVAGIVAAEANNGIGIAGVSYNARILPVKVFHTSSNNKLEASTLSLCRAYDYILDHAAEYSIKVVNISVGGAFSEGTTLEGSDKALIESIDSAYGKGILTVCSSGNEARSKGAYFNYPSDWADNALGVIALQKGSNGSDPVKAYYSNYNRSGQTTKDISAPGSSIYSVDITNDSAYTSKDGTSMAAPCVAGVAALVYAAKPDATAAQVADIICSTAKKINSSTVAYDSNGFSLEYGYGEVDAEAAVLAAKGAHLQGDSSLLVGSTMELTPKNLDASQTHGSWIWSSSDNSIATVANGTVTGKSGGNVTITATSGNVKLTKDLTVYQASFSGETTLAYGSLSKLAFNAAPDKGQWKFSSSNKGVASISSSDSSGNCTVSVLGAGCGTATLTATLASNPSVKVSAEITVEPAPMESVSIEPIDNQAYTGSAVTPEPIVSFNGSTLQKDIDYTVSYENNVAVNIDESSASAPTVIVTGKGNFTGTSRETFKICKSVIGDGSVSVETKSCIYNGSAFEPKVNVKYDGKTLTEGADYTVDYSNNVNAGTASVTVKGEGTFAGQVTKRFTIAPAQVAVPEAVVGLVFNGSKHSGVKAADSQNGTTALYTLSGHTATNAGSYNAKATLKDTRNYCWTDGTTAAKSITWKIATKPVVPAVILSSASFTFNGKTQVPTITVKDGSKTLGGNDYTVSLPSGCTNAGSYKVSVTCKGNYSGRGSATFTIASVEVAAPKAVAGLVYTGSKQTGVKATTVAVGDSTKPGCTVAGNTATNAGSYSARAKLIDTKNYRWSDGTTADKVIGWRINAVSLVGAELKDVPAYRYFTGKALKPAIYVSHGSKTLKKGADYTISYTNNKSIGTATVTAKGMGNYTGSVSAAFKIIGKPSYAGATKMPENSKAFYALKNCTLKVLDGEEFVSVSGSTVTAKAAGKAHLGVYDKMGVLVSKRTVKVYKLTGKTRIVKTALNKRYALTVKGASRADGANILLGKVRSANVYRFKFTLQPDGSYTLKNKATGKFVTVKGASVAAGANVVQQMGVAKAHQRWRITVDASNRLTFVSKRSGMALGVAGGKAANKQNVKQYNLKTVLAQKWTLAS